jgi:integrase
MEWGELSGGEDDLDTWTIRPQRAKNGAAHMVPLAAAAREIVKAAPRADEILVFAAQRAGRPFSGWSKSLAILSKAAGVSGWSLHDLRRTLATGFQRLGVRLEVTEAVLNHISGSRAGIVGVYQRHDWAAEKRAALEAWAAHVLAVVEDRPAEQNVVRLGR